MEYKDLSAYRFQSDDGNIILNIGWLNDNSFQKGNVHIEVKRKLEKLIRGEFNNINIIAFVTRGLNLCPLCKRTPSDPWGKPIILGDINLSHVEILIPSTIDKNCFYISPSLIYHYIDVHQYYPPEDFLNSILQFPEDTEYDAQVIVGDEPTFLRAINSD
ncbi:DUF7919 family protein [Bartonella sp. HY761]|uniref:DUF7919 family protein n=1 Tax=Bartonella sp. HY761 TaxID=2979330 RepID=UPI00220996EE|nr:hypothetical protein [Bartonella sp. HY761]UXN05577.1 hypothetical protein N6A79_09745 [Bartonella sp. HY761]